MYNGTSGISVEVAETPGNAGAAYVTRTRDPIITNKGYPRKTAVFSASCVLICAICADFVRVPHRFQVHMYIGPRRCWSSTPALTETMLEHRMATDLLALQRKLSNLRIDPDGVNEWRAELLARYSELPTAIGPFSIQDEYNREQGLLGTFAIHVQLVKNGDAELEGGFTSPYDALRRMIDYAEAWETIRPREQVYFIGTALRPGKPVKIGFSRDPMARLRTLQTAHSEELRIFATVEGGKGLEAKYHRRWSNRRQKGEWFTLGECIIKEIDRINSEQAA